MSTSTNGSKGFTFLISRTSPASSTRLYQLHVLQLCEIKCVHFDSVCHSKEFYIYQLVQTAVFGFVSANDFYC